MLAVGEGRWNAPNPEGSFTYLEIHVDAISYNVDRATAKSPPDTKQPPRRHSREGPSLVGTRILPHPGRRTECVVATVGLVAPAAVRAGWLLPRGPVTAPHAVVCLVVAVAVAVTVAVGFGAGGLLRNRWAVLISLVVFVAVFEVARMRVKGGGGTP